MWRPSARCEVVATAERISLGVPDHIPPKTNTIFLPARLARYIFMAVAIVVGLEVVYVEHDAGEGHVALLR